MNRDLPPPPTKPSNKDCCGRDCAVCVFDLYDQEFQIWENECEKIKQSAVILSQDRSEDKSLKHDCYSDFVVKKLKYLTGDVIELELSAANPSLHPLSINPGQHVVMRVKDDESSSASRQLTPFNVSHDSFKIMIKLKLGGTLSKYAQNLREENYVSLRGPFGGLSYKVNHYENIWMFSIGVAIAPLLTYIEPILKNEEEETEIILCCGFRKYEDILKKDLLDNWSSYWNFKVKYFLSGETVETVASKKRYKDDITLSRLNESTIKTFILEAKKRPSQGCQASYVVGSIDFELMVEEVLCSSHDSVFRFTSI